jgi:hypothetical protein
MIGDGALFTREDAVEVAGEVPGAFGTSRALAMLNSDCRLFQEESESCWVGF